MTLMEKGRGLAGQGLADALGQYRVDFDQLIRVVIEHIADGGIDFGGAVPLSRIDLHLELALVRGIRILAVLGPPDLLGNALHAGNRHQPSGDSLADASGFGQRYPRPQGRVSNQVILPEIRQQARAEQGQTGNSRNTAGDENRQQHPRSFIQPFYRLQLPALETLQKSRLGPGPMMRHRKYAKCRRGAHCNQQ